MVSCLAEKSQNKKKEKKIKKMGFAEMRSEFDVKFGCSQGNQGMVPLFKNANDSKKNELFEYFFPISHCLSFY